jgi:hypothetical protein
MEANEIINFIKSVLSESNIKVLNALNKAQNQDLRRVALRKFFHTEEIFDKIKPTVDPTWLSSEIFTKGIDYEF